MTYSVFTNLSVVEYGCVVWHHDLTTAQSNRLEALQKRALRIILHPITLQYNTALAYCEIESLRLRQYNFQNKFFKEMCHPENCLHDLLPSKRDPSVSLRLRHPTVYPIPQVRTNRYCSFINYAFCTIIGAPFYLFYISSYYLVFSLYRYSIVLAIFASVSLLVL